MVLVVCSLIGLCGEDAIRCPEGTCLSADERCDGQVHCSDGSDEPITCGKFETDYSDGKCWNKLLDTAAVVYQSQTTAFGMPLVHVFL